MISRKLKAFIVDDEVLNVETLDKLIRDYCPNVMVVARCSVPEEAIPLVHDLKPDIVFLDISMPGLNGFEFLNEFDKISFKTIFTTAHSEYALKAIRYAAFDYLLKPIDHEELQAAVERARLEIFTQKPTDIVQHTGPSTNLALPTMEGFTFIDINEIVYCKSDNNYTEFILVDGKKIYVSRGMKETSEMLEKHAFLRIHQSYLINGKCIKNYSKKSSTVVLSNGESIPISTRKKEEFLHFVSKL